MPLAANDDATFGRRLLQALGEAPALIAILRGPDLVYEFVNDAYVQRLPIGNPIGKAFGATEHQTTPELRAVLQRVYETGEPWARRAQRVGEEYFDVNFRPIRDETGSVEAVMIHSFDVTDLVHARERAAASEAHQRRLFDSNMLGMALWRADGTITEANDELLRILSVGREDLARGLKNVGLTPHELTREARRPLDEVLASGTCTPFEAALPARNGKTVPVLVGCAAFDDGALSGATFVIDLTAQKEAEEAREKMQAQLLQVQKLESLGVMAGGIAHDFNNLLTGILGNASIALLRMPRESAARSPLEDLVAIGRRAADLTRQLLAYSGKGKFQVQPIDLSMHVKEIAQLLEASLPKKVQLRIEVADGLPAIEADVAQLQQVVMNLVLNAGEAIGDERGVVLVTTGVQEIDDSYALELVAPEPLKPGLYVFLEVHDTGCGMDLETQRKIFDPFFTTKFSGRGLGLAAVLGIVRGHKGAIRIYSTVKDAPDRRATGRSGTTFKVLFPASDRATTSSRREALSVRRGEGLVLVVDDEADLRKTAARILDDFGYRTVQARDGREAVAIFRARADEIDVVLLDMTMPEMNGEEAFREMRRVRSDVRVVLSSGYDEVEATRRFTSSGIAGFLQKPYTAEDLAAKIAAALADER